jgi:hypothetical protein
MFVLGWGNLIIDTNVLENTLIFKYFIRVVKLSWIMVKIYRNLLKYKYEENIRGMAKLANY